MPSIVGKKLGGTIFDFFGVQGITPQQPRFNLESKLEYFNGIMGYDKKGNPMSSKKHEAWLIKNGFYGMNVQQMESWAKKSGLGSIFSTNPSFKNSTIPRQTRSSMQKILDRLKSSSSMKKILDRSKSS